MLILRIKTATAATKTIENLECYDNGYPNGSGVHLKGAKEFSFDTDPSEIG